MSLDHKNIAIADVIKHSPTQELYSHQPYLDGSISPKIRVRNVRGKVSYIYTEDCVWPTTKEYKEYWKNFNKNMDKDDIEVVK